jgi:Fe(3+) dicitrate transport protein
MKSVRINGNNLLLIIIRNTGGHVSIRNISRGGLLAGVACMTMAGTGLVSPARADSGPKVDIVVVGDWHEADTLAGSAALVTETDLSRSRVFSVNDALRQVAGVFPRDEEGAGARPNIGIRGLNPVRSTKVLLLEDGIPLGFAPYGDNAAYYHPPIERFSSIEVLKGAGQVRFGPQTIGGVINYITPEPGDRLGAKLTGSLGNRDLATIDGMVSGPALGGGLLLHATHKRTDGNRQNQDLRFTDIFLKGGWELGAVHGIVVKVSRFAEDSQLTYSGLRRDEFAADPRGNLFRNDSFKTTRWNATVSHRWDLSSDLTLRTSVYYHRFSRDWWRQSSNSGQRPNDASDPACGGIANLSTTCGNEGRLRDYETVGIESRLTIDHAGLGIGGSTELGVRYHDEQQRRRQWNGDTPLARQPGSGVNAGVRENNERDAAAFSAFAQSRLEFGDFALTPGVRAEFIDYHRSNLPVDVTVGGIPTGAKTVASQADSSLDKLLPGVGFTWAIARGATLYGGVHRGFSPPRVEDIITAAGGTVDLGPELSWNWELGLRGEPVAGLRADATLFVMNFSNQIVSQSVAGGVGATLTSAGRTLHRGGELSLALSSRDAGWSEKSDVFARLAATWIGTARYSSTRMGSAPCFDGAVTGTPVQTGSGMVPCGVPQDLKGNRLPYSPEWLVTAALGIERDGFTGQVELVGQSSMYADDANLVPVTPDGQRGRINGWTQMNVALSYGPPQGHWEIFASARNLFDKLYVVDRARGVLPGQPLTVQAGITLRY